MGVGSKPAFRVRFPLPPHLAFVSIVTMLDRKSKYMTGVLRNRFFLQNAHFVVVMLDRSSRISP
jgi:hypothetical protein